ncbi:MAG: hypothetical protein WCX31_09110 [Salinivirgaceae bacterium]
MKRLMLFIYILTVSNFLFSQKSNYFDGYVITYNNDTILGQIKDIKDFRKHNKIVLRKETEKLNYSPDMIKEYKIKERKFFSYDKRFLELVVQGKITLLLNRHFQIVYGANGYYYPTGVRKKYYAIKDGDFFGIRKFHFKKDFTCVFHDNPEWIEKVKNKQYKYADLVKIIEMINDQNEEKRSFDSSMTKNIENNKIIKSQNNIFQIKTIWLLNGKRINSMNFVLDSIDEYNPRVSYFNSKGKEKHFFTDEVYSFQGKVANEVILYHPQQEIGETFSKVEMKDYLIGLSDAKTYRPSPLLMIGSFSSGVLGALVPSPEVKLGESTMPVPIGILIPTAYIGLSGVLSPNVDKLKNKTPISNPTDSYLMGYQEGVKKKIIKNSLLSAGIGFVAGFIIVVVAN